MSSTKFVSGRSRYVARHREAKEIHDEIIEFEIMIGDRYTSSRVDISQKKVPRHEREVGEGPRIAGRESRE